MARPARFDRDQIVAATAEVVARRGPAGASVARIARALEGPTGSIYHRFPSRAVLLGEVWLRAAASFQRAVAERLAGADPRAAGLAAARFVPQRVRERPREARILLLHRREDFLEPGWPAALTERAEALRRQLSGELRGFCKRLTGRSDLRVERVVRFALAEAPLAAVRPHVEAGEPPPVVIDELIERTYLASLALIGVTE